MLKTLQEDISFLSSRGGLSPLEVLQAMPIIVILLLVSGVGVAVSLSVVVTGTDEVVIIKNRAMKWALNFLVGVGLGLCLSFFGFLLYLME